MYNSNPKMQLSTASHQLNSALFFMLEQIGLTGLFNQKVKCENKLRKTRLSFPQASHSSDTFFLDSKLIFFSQQLSSPQPSAQPLVLTFLPAASQPRQLPRTPRPREAGAARRFAAAGNWEGCQRSQGSLKLLPESPVILPVPSPKGSQLCPG